MGHNMYQFTNYKSLVDFYYASIFVVSLPFDISIYVISLLF